MTTKAQLAQHEFGRAAANLIEAWLQQIADADVQKGLAIVRALQAGAFVTVTASSSPATLAMWAAMTMTDIQGKVTELCCLDFDTAADGRPRPRPGTMHKGARP